MAGDVAAAVVVMCAALDVEYQAIREHLAGPVAEVEERGTLYEVGKLATDHGRWQVVLLLTGRENTPAAVQVERAIAAFGPQVVLFVGVAGGRRGVRIGDVVAGSVIYNYESGLDANDGLRYRIKTLPSSFRLVQQAHAVVREGRWTGRIKPAPPPDPPRASVGPLAAGGKVVAGGLARTARLIEANCNDALGVETEGFGVLHAVHVNQDTDALVIRGISDLLDGKNKTADRTDQPNAARNAAAFALELVHRLKPDGLRIDRARPATGPSGTVTQSGRGLGTSEAEPFRLEDHPLGGDAGLADAGLSSLSALLRAASQIVPFTGRADELVRLRSWREAPGQLSVMLISGPAGQGKTRLAWKFASDSAAEGWAVRHARHGSETPPRAPCAAGVGQRGVGQDGEDLLVVADYAERWPQSDLQRLIQAGRLSGASRARVLLLARPAWYWWKALANPLAKLGASSAELPLGPLADTVAKRHLAFTTARDQFAAVLGSGDVSRLRPVGSLADDAYQLALTLHMAALVAVDAHRRDSAPPEDPGQLSRYLIGREYDHWRAMCDSHSISVLPPVMARLVALATLTQSLPRGAALDLLVLVGLAGNRAGAQALLDDHACCYPVTTGLGRALEPLRPDRLGEDFLADLMPGIDPGGMRGDSWMAAIPRQLLTQPVGPPPGWRPAAMSVLVETARRWEHVRQGYLVPLLIEQPGLALTGGGAVLVKLAGYADIELLKALATVLPEQRHVELDSGIAALTKRLTDYGLAQTTDDSERAKLHDDVADRYSNAGLYREALAATGNAIVIRRRLAHADPARHQPNLANSLGNLGIDLWNLGRSAEALEAMTEAVTIYRQLADAAPDAYQDDLAAEMNNLAGSLLALERYEEALAPATQAAAIFRQRAQAGSGSRHELGTCLRNLSVIRSGLGQHQEALAAAREAAETYRHLARAQPETYEVELAESLRSLGNRLSRLRHDCEALVVAEESVAIARRLTEASPVGQRQNLALALQSLAARLWSNGQRERSLAVSEETLTMYRDLIRDNPRAHEHGLGIVLNSYAEHLVDVSRPHEALPAAEEAADLWRRLAAATPAAAARQLDRATATRDRALAAFGP